MPIGRFTKCMSGDLSQVSKNKYFDALKARKAWGKLFDQHIKAHGLPDSYTDYVKLMAKALHFYDQSNKGKRWMVVKARLYESEANQLLAVEGEKIETTCARISKFLGFPVRANECTVVEFYNYVAIIGT